MSITFTDETIRCLLQEKMSSCVLYTALFTLPLALGKWGTHSFSETTIRLPVVFLFLSNSIDYYYSNNEFTGALYHGYVIHSESEVHVTIKKMTN